MNKEEYRKKIIEFVKECDMDAERQQIRWLFTSYILIFNVLPDEPGEHEADILCKEIYDIYPFDDKPSYDEWVSFLFFYLC